MSFCAQTKKSAAELSTCFFRRLEVGCSAPCLTFFSGAFLSGVLRAEGTAFSAL